jgi:hypothetical protein
MIGVSSGVRSKQDRGYRWGRVLMLLLTIQARLALQFIPL